MKIKAISDIITNSSSECYIMKNSEKLYGSLNWEDILEGGNGNIGRDLMIQILTEYYHLELKENPFPATKDCEEPWDQTSYSWNWERSEVDEVWEDFVNLNKEAFEKLIGVGFVYGPEDNQYYDYDEWVSVCKDYRNDSLMWQSRGGGCWVLNG